MSLEARCLTSASAHLVLLPARNANCFTVQSGVGLITDATVRLFVMNTYLIACNEDKFFPGLVRCNLDATGTVTTAKACQDGYADAVTGKCVTNCGQGKYGSATFSSRGLVQSAQCYSCDPSCAECVGSGTG